MHRSYVSRPFHLTCKIQPCMWRTARLHAASACRHRRTHDIVTRHRQRSIQAGILFVSCCRRKRSRQDRSCRCGRLQESVLVHKSRNDRLLCVTPAQRAHHLDMRLRTAHKPCPAGNGLHDTFRSDGAACARLGARAVLHFCSDLRMAYTSCVSQLCLPPCNDQHHTKSTMQRLRHCTCCQYCTDDTCHRHRENSNQLRKGFACSSRRSCIPQGTICMSCVSHLCRPMCTNRPRMSSTVPLPPGNVCCHRRTRGTATRRHQRNSPANNALASSCHRTSNPWGRPGTCDLRSRSA